MITDESPLLLSKRFLPLFMTQFFSAFTNNAFKSALFVWFAFGTLNNSTLNPALLVTLSAGIFMLPFFIFSATAGQLADKYEKSWLTQKIKQFEIVLLIASAIIFHFHHIYGLIIILFFVGVQATFFGPIKYALLPENLQDHELISGNGLIETGTFLAILLGTILGGLIIRIPYGISLLSGILIIISIISWKSSCYIPKSRIADPSLKIRWRVLTETWKIIRFAVENKIVWFSIMSISWFWLIGATFLTQFPSYTRDIIHGNERIVTLFLTMFSIGICVGSSLCNRLLKGEINSRLIPWGCMGMSLFILDFYLGGLSFHSTQPEQLIGIKLFLNSYQGWRIIFDLFMLAVFAGIYIVPLYTMMQHFSNKHQLGRIVAVNNIMNAFFMVMANVISFGLLYFGCNINQIFLILAIANVGVFFLVFRFIRK